MFSLKNLYKSAVLQFHYGTGDEAVILDGQMNIAGASSLSVELYTGFLIEHAYAGGRCVPTQATYDAQRYWHISQTAEKVDLRHINTVPVQLAVHDAVYLRLPKQLALCNIIEYNKAGIANFVGAEAPIYRECDQILQSQGYTEALQILQEWRPLQASMDTADRFGDGMILQEKTREFAAAIRSDIHARRFKQQRLISSEPA